MYSDVFVNFSTVDGKCVPINKYYLFLYSEFYSELLHSHDHEDLVFIFEALNKEDLVNLSKDINNKHMNCQVKCKNQTEHNEAEDTEEEPNEKITKEVNEELIEELTEEPTEEPEIQRGISSTEEIIENERDSPLVDNKHPKCPFPCQNADKPRSPDQLFAHLYSKHPNEIESNYFIAIDTFISKLEEKISRKCIFNCKDKQYNLSALKAHYKDSHFDEPVDCEKCGKRFKNKIRLKSHMYNVEMRQDFNREICGKVSKN